MPNNYISAVGHVYAKEVEFGYRMCNIAHVIFIAKLDLTVTKVNMHAKNEDGAATH